MNRQPKCFKCETSTGRIVKHHISYSPERIVDCCWSCHQLIHKRIRKNNSCSLSVKETDRLSHISSEKRYIKKAIRRIDFKETLLPYVELHEEVAYNLKTNNIWFSSHFSAQKRKELYYLD